MPSQKTDAYAIYVLERLQILLRGNWDGQLRQRGAVGYEISSMEPYGQLARNWLVECVASGSDAIMRNGKRRGTGEVLHIEKASNKATSESLA